MNTNVPKINYFSFADDTIVFWNGRKKPLEMMLNTLKVYEDISSQYLNKDKIFFAVANNTKVASINRIKNIIGINHQPFPIKYLGRPIISRKKKVYYYSEMVSKTINKISGRQTKFLSTGGRAFLIRHVLFSILIHILVATNPPIGTIDLIKKYIVRFF